MDDRRTFRIACKIGHTLGYGFFRRFLEFSRQGKLMESLQTHRVAGACGLEHGALLGGVLCAAQR